MLRVFSRSLALLLLLLLLLLCCFRQVLEGVTPQVQFVKIVSDELVQLMGAEGSKDLNPGQPQVILMAGLQVRSTGFERRVLGRVGAGFWRACAVCMW